MCTKKNMSFDLEKCCGLTISEIEFENEQCITLHFENSTGRMELYAVGDCCSRSTFENVGEYAHIIGGTITGFERGKEYIDSEKGGEFEAYKYVNFCMDTTCGEWTFQLQNVSNGYYCGWVECNWIDEPAECETESSEAEKNDDEQSAQGQEECEREQGRMGNKGERGALTVVQSTAAAMDGAPTIVTFVVGLPGAGKTFFTDGMKREGDVVFDDAIAEATVSVGKHTWISDPRLCDFQTFEIVRRRLCKMCNDVEFRTLCFENDVQKCLENAKAREDSRNVEHQIRTYSQVYFPQKYEPIAILKIVT